MGDLARSGKLPAVRIPASEEIIAPEFPRGLEWINVAFLRMDQLIGRSVVMVEFWDFARVNSLRTLPYLTAWHDRYRDAGLRVILVQSPGYSFGRDPAVARAAIERLGITMPVVLDPEFATWREYGNRGWPGRYLFDREGVLRFFHYGEGEYDDTELAVQDLLHELDPDVELPEPLEPVRPEDAPGVRLEAQTADVVLPADAGRLELVRDWSEGEDFIEARDAGAAATVRSFSAGGVWAVLSGGELEPGLYETDGTVVAESPGVRLHGFQFTPVPPPSPS
jgi:AhpC/TSA family